MFLEFIVFTCFAVAIIAMLLVAIGYYFRHAQDLLLYHPDTPVGSTTSCDTPQAWDIKHSERTEIVTADGVTLAGFLMKAPKYQQQQNNSNGNTNTNAPAAAASSSTFENNNNTNNTKSDQKQSSSSSAPTLLVYFHGNAGNVGHRLSIAKQFLDENNVDVLMVDYRGYGLSDAVRPCEVGLQLDAAAVMDYVDQQATSSSSSILRKKVIVMGVSLGGAVALYLASHRKYRQMMSGLILENTFVGISEMGDAMLAPMINSKYGKDGCGGKVVSFLLRYFLKPLVIQIHWRSIDRIPQVGVPILFLSGLKDELVPPSHMKKLFENAIRAPFKRFVAFETGKHNDLCGKDGFFEQIGKFVEYVEKKEEM